MPEHYCVIPEKAPADSGLEYAACPLCCEDVPELLFKACDHYAGQPGEFGVVKCSACGFVYTNPRPFGSKLGEFYPDDAGYYQPDVTADGLRAETLSGNLYAPLCKYLGYGRDSGGRVSFSNAGMADKAYRRGFPRFLPGGKLLEVGCSYGKFMYQLKCLGWETKGLELNAKAAEFARTGLGLDVDVATVEEADLAENYYDCVVMRMVLEHIPSPVDCLRKLAASMKPGGELVIAVPNFGCLETRWFGRYAYFLHVPQHMNHFTPESLQRAFEMSGFEMTRLVPIKSSRDLVQSAETKAAEAGPTFLTRLLGMKWFQRSIMKVWLALAKARRRSSRMMVYARKVS